MYPWQPMISLSLFFFLLVIAILRVVMYGCESWTIKKAECRRIDAFEPWCWRRLLRVPWTARRSNQSILKEVSPGCSLEGLMLKLKLEYFGYLMQRAYSFEKTLMLWRIAGRKRRAWQRIRWLVASPTQWTWVWVNSRSWWWTGRPGVLVVHGVAKSRTRLSDWTDWTGVKWYLIVVLNCISQLVILSIVSCTCWPFTYLLGNMSIESLVHFKVKLLFFDNEF